MTADLHDCEPATVLDRTAAEDALVELLPALARLDQLLERAAQRVPAVYGAQVASDRYRGLYVSEADVEQLLAREAAGPLFGTDRDEAPGLDLVGHGSRLASLAETFGLTPFDLDVVLLALAPDIDLRYERLYAYLQDDVTRRRPTVDLALNLFCASAAERIARRSHFGADAPLVSGRLIDLLSDGGTIRAPLLAHAIALDEQALNFILGHTALDRRLTGCCRYLSSSAEVSAPRDVVEALATAMDSALRRAAPLALHVTGLRGSGKQAAVVAAAALLDRRVLLVDLFRAFEMPEWERTLALALREAWMHGGVAYVRAGDALLAPDRRAAREGVEDALASGPGLIVLSTTHPWPGGSLAGMVEIPFGIPSFKRRAALWHGLVVRAGGALTWERAEALASRFRFTPRKIAATVATATRQVEWSAGAGTVGGADALTAADLFAGARRNSGHELAALATRIEPVHGWDDLVLPEDSIAQLREICQRVAHRHRVLEEWGFERRLSRGRGVNALFSGSSGTGKTMAAEVVAGALELDLYRVELAGVVSKYIGETEKNLDRIFEAAERSNGIVFFDEADALFGKRSEVHDAHDRYANIEISYLLQRIEAYDGVAILSTNLRGNLDAAFVRRLAFAVHFPFPDAASRERIWRGVWPAAVPLGEDVNFEFLAAQFAVSGGNIKNVALAAAFFAAQDGGRVAMRHVLAAIRREYQKLGKTLSPEELGPFAAWGSA